MNLTSLNTCKHMSERLFIPDDPTALIDTPSFAEARIIIAEQVHALPVETINPEDTLMLRLYQECAPVHIIPELAYDKKDEQRGKTEIHLQACFTEDDRMLPASTPEYADEYDLHIGDRYSREFLKKLSTEQRIAVTQFAFALRYEELSAAIEKTDVTRKAQRFSRLMERRNTLEETYETVMRRLQSA